jgi:hypothetical protein
LSSAKVLRDLIHRKDWLVVLLVLWGGTFILAAIIVTAILMN